MGKKCITSRNLFYNILCFRKSTCEIQVNDFKAAGASSLTFHVEAVQDPAELIRKIRETGMKVGLAVKPGTPVESVFPFLDDVDMILIMTVEPGFGGQSFMPDMMPKVKALRTKKPALNIQVPKD